MTTLEWARLSNDAFNVALFAYSPRWSGTSRTWRSGATSIWRVARAVAYVGLAANLVSIVARGFAAHRVPWGNMYEYSSAARVPRGRRVPRDRRGRLQAAGARRVRADVLGPHDGRRRVVPLRRAGAARARAELLLDQDPRAGRDLGLVAASRSAASSRSCTWCRTGGSAGGSTRSEPRIPRRSWAASIDMDAPHDLVGDASDEAASGEAAARRGVLPAGRHARPDRVPDHRVRVPDLDLRRDRGRDLGAGGVGPVLGLGPEGDLVVHHLDDLRRATCTRARRRDGAGARPP